MVLSAPQTVTMPGDGRDSHMSEASAADFRDAVSRTGALVTGRRLVDMTRSWGGRHPAGAPVFVVTARRPEDWSHPEAPFTFVLDGVVSAVEQAQAVAGDEVVGIASANVAQRCLNAGMLDGIQVSLVPVLLGKGTPFYAGLTSAPVELDASRVTGGAGVTHLRYRVRR